MNGSSKKILKNIVVKKIILKRHGEVKEMLLVFSLSVYREILISATLKVEPSQNAVLEIFILTSLVEDIFIQVGVLKPATLQKELPRVRLFVIFRTTSSENNV